MQLLRQAANMLQTGTLSQPGTTTNVQHPVELSNNAVVTQATPSPTANVVRATSSGSQQNRAVEEHRRLFNRQSVCSTIYNIYE
jgi:hypothetical protein